MKTHREKLIDNIIKTQAHLDLVRIGFAQKNNELWQLLLETKDGEDEIRTNENVYSMSRNETEKGYVSGSKKRGR